MVRNLFVYGTLRSGFRNRYALLLSRQGVLLGRARVRGRLYDLGSYPALCPASGEHWATGELFALRTPARTLAMLDAYEGPDYPRVVTRALLDDGRTVPAWVYRYRRALPEWRLLASGEYPSPVAKSPPLRDGAMDRV